MQRVPARTEPRTPGDPGSVTWRATLKRRTVVAAVIVGLWAAGIEARLVYLQVYSHADLVAKASKQQMHRIEAPAERGDIVDRKGRVLATSVDADSIFAVPLEIENADEAAAKLCAAFGDCTAKERQALSDRLHQPRWTYVRRQVPPDEKRRVEALNLDGIKFMKESHRFYPNMELAAHLLGYVGVDNLGLGGIESAYDSQIRGKAGTVLIQTDARQHAFSTRVIRLPTAGSTVELTIDEYLQHVAERELRAGVIANHAAGGTAIVMNPRTGEILALANEPTFNPNAYHDSQEFERRNRAVQDLYEPGSTFKVVTASAAIEEKVMPLDTLIDTNPGQIRIDRTRIVRDMRNHGVLSFSNVIVESSNVGAIKIGALEGSSSFNGWVHRFGFGVPTGVDLSGEEAGVTLPLSHYSGSSMGNLPIGQGELVTPMQMASAYGAIANGGILRPPHIVRAVGGKPRFIPAGHRIISAATAAAVRHMLEGVLAPGGTASEVSIPGYQLAGKTGTASKVDPATGEYSKSAYVASFIGFAPAADPKLLCAVVVDEPQSGSIFGGTVAAPAFGQIMSFALQYLGIAPG